MAEPANQSVTRTRHDAFDGERRRTFLTALAKSGCVRDAARCAGVSHQTVYTHQGRDPRFARQCDLALEMASTDLELHAWERGVVGIEEPIVYRGEVVGTRVRRSDAILKLLLQGAKPRKYGRNPGFTRRRLHALERQRVEREVRDEMRERHRHLEATAEDTNRAILRKLAALDAVRDRQRRAEGWIKDGENWIPPGWVRAAIHPDGSSPGTDQIPDSV